jgi:hypothetical protein
MMKRIVGLALKGTAMAMGTAVIVLNTLGTLTPTSAIGLLAIGLTALSLAVLQEQGEQK